MPSDNPHTIDTIGKLIDGGYGLHAYCNARGCAHNAPLDLAALARRLGRDHSHLHQDIAPMLRCSRCGGTDVGIQLAPHY